jgi:hypothetical protein
VSSAVLRLRADERYGGRASGNEVGESEGLRGGEERAREVRIGRDGGE